MSGHPASVDRRLGGGKSLVAGARIRPRLLERSPTPMPPVRKPQAQARGMRAAPRPAPHRYESASDCGGTPAQGRQKSRRRGEDTPKAPRAFADPLASLLQGAISPLHQRQMRLSSTAAHQDASPRERYGRPPRESAHVAGTRGVVSDAGRPCPPGSPPAAPPRSWSRSRYRASSTSTRLSPRQ